MPRLTEHAVLYVSTAVADKACVGPDGSVPLRIFISYGIYMRKPEKGDRKQQRRQAAELLRTVTDFEKRSQKAIDEKEILVYYCIIGLIQLLFIFTTRNICQRKYITKLLPCSGFKTASRIFAFGGEADSGGLEYIVRFRKEECYGMGFGFGQAHLCPVG